MDRSAEEPGSVIEQKLTASSDSGKPIACLYDSSEEHAIFLSMPIQKRNASSRAIIRTP